jgi:hypothetical protein
MRRIHEIHLKIGVKANDEKPKNAANHHSVNSINKQKSGHYGGPDQLRI